MSGDRCLDLGLGVAGRTDDGEGHLLVELCHRRHDPFDALASFGRADDHDVTVVPDQLAPVANDDGNGLGERVVHDPDAIRAGLGGELRSDQLARHVHPRPGVDRTTDGGPFGGDGGLDSLRVSHRGEILHGEHRGRRGRAEEVRAVDDIDVAGQLSSARPRGPTPGVRGHRGGERGAPRRPWKRRHRAASREEPARDLDVVSSGERIGEVAGVLMDAGRWTDERGDVETDAQGVVHRVVYRIAYMPSKTSVSPTTCSPSRCDDRWVWTVAHLSSRPR